MNLTTSQNLMTGENYIFVNNSTQKTTVIYWAVRPTTASAPEVGEAPFVPVYPSTISDAGWTVQADQVLYAWASGLADGILNLVRAE